MSILIGLTAVLLVAAVMLWVQSVITKAVSNGIFSSSLETKDAFIIILKAGLFAILVYIMTYALGALVGMASEAIGSIVILAGSVLALLAQIQTYGVSIHDETGEQIGFWKGAAVYLLVGFILTLIFSAIAFSVSMMGFSVMALM